MRTMEDCFVCFMKQALKTLHLCTDDHALRCHVLQEVSGMLQGFDLDHAPPENAAFYYRHIARATGVTDPFYSIKKQSNEKALSLEQDVRSIITSNLEPLLAATKFAIGANVLDSGSQKQLDFESTIHKCLHRNFAIDHYHRFDRQAAKGVNILYLCDNCGEIVFDKLLIEQLQQRGCEVTAVVRNAPVINDATYADAVSTGLTDTCPVVTNGADIPGTSLRQCSIEFQQLFHRADCIISKGMGNFECLSSVNAPIFFLFTIKCSSVLACLQEIFGREGFSIGSPVLISKAEYMD